MNEVTGNGEQGTGFNHVEHVNHVEVFFDRIYRINRIRSAEKGLPISLGTMARSPVLGGGGPRTDRTLRHERGGRRKRRGLELSEKRRCGSREAPKAFHQAGDVADSSIRL